MDYCGKIKWPDQMFERIEGIVEQKVRRLNSKR